MTVWSLFKEATVMTFLCCILLIKYLVALCFIWSSTFTETIIFVNNVCAWFYIYYHFTYYHTSIQAHTHTLHIQNIWQLLNRCKLTMHQSQTASYLWCLSSAPWSSSPPSNPSRRNPIKQHQIPHQNAHHHTSTCEPPPLWA